METTPWGVACLALQGFEFLLSSTQTNFPYHNALFVVVWFALVLGFSKQGFAA